MGSYEPSWKSLSTARVVSRVCTLLRSLRTLTRDVAQSLARLSSVYAPVLPSRWWCTDMTLPDRPENYIHRVGRVGRAGNPGLAISIVGACSERVRSAF